MWLNGFNYCHLTRIIIFNINLVYRQGNDYKFFFYFILIILFQHYPFKGSNYYYVIPIIQFRHKFQVLLFNTNYSIFHNSFVCTQLNSSKNLLRITNNSIKDQSYFYTQLNDQTVLFQTINLALVISLHSF